jgi:hypothetical protein
MQIADWGMWNSNWVFESHFIIFNSKSEIRNNLRSITPIRENIPKQGGYPVSAFRKKSVILLLAAVLVVSWAAFPALAEEEKYQYDSEEFSDAVTMGVDLFVVRPIWLVGTVLGTAAFIVSLPFTILGGNTGEAAQKLVVAPAKYTFTRPLGKGVY